ncbi:hypothetical protein B0F90DRAFT_1626461 [Multifurca ochricompacta]|uniref:Plasma membrane fusion protein PRM1 n=1 Tax=Multifurca ochricompacta TaxID=376703 RepID=A0AAD4QPP6_9AGAM|nr:hypothetical protein B0F90DRAFT_1626461 [Multifurca ochricompacta]
MSIAPPPARWMSPPPVYDSRTTVSKSGLTPYLQLPHILSLTWLAYPFLSLLFIAFRLQLSSDSAQTAVSNAKGELLTSCQAAQQAASSAASMPRFMAIATNDQIADAVNASMNGAREALVLSLTVMEAIINFVVDIYRSTFLCFLELIVRGGLSLIIGATQEINTFLTNTFSSLRTSIQNDVTTANSAIQTAIDGINKVNPFGNIKAPQFSIPSLDSLQNVTLPTDFQDALTKLNASIPSVSVLKDTVNNLLDTPFEAVKKDINDTFAGISFNSSVLPVPDRSALTFCDNMDTSVIDDLGHDLLHITKIGIILVAILAVVLLAGYFLLEWYKWLFLKRHLEYTRQAWMSDPAVVHLGPAIAPTITLSDHNLLMLQADSAHPLLTRLANRISAILHLTPSQHINLSWFFHYVFHPPALACFLIGFFGILSVQLQLLAVAPLEAKFHDRTNAAVSDFSGTIFTSLNQSMYDQSALYANGINNHIDNIQSTINDGLFGWVNGTTTTLNNTINTFYSDLQNAVSTLFNGTILEQPAQDFIKCLIGSKVDAIEEALTFLHDHLHVDISRVNESILVLSPDEVNAATRPIATAAVGSTDGSNGGLVGRLINTYVQSLRKERVMFAIFLGLWALVVLMALVIIFWHSYGCGILHSRRKRKFQRDQRTGFNKIMIPFRGEEPKKEAKSIPQQTILSPSSIRLIDPNHPEHLHPLSNLTPAATKSFDSFFDHTSPATAQPPETGGVMRALSRKLRGDSSWRKRMTDSLRGDKAATRKSFRKAHRPQLAISTERAASVRNYTLPEIERASPSMANVSHELKSAWSLSPDTARIQINPGARRKPSVPVSVGEVESGAPSPAAVVHTHLAVPLHYGFARSAPARKVYLAPSPTVPPIPIRRPPVPAQVFNPFSTPFDDDAKVVTPVTAESMAGFSFVPLSAKEGSPETSFTTGRAL